MTTTTTNNASDISIENELNLYQSKYGLLHHVRISPPHTRDNTEMICVGVLVCWCVGVLVCWCVGVLVCWCVGVGGVLVLVCWCVGVGITD